MRSPVIIKELLGGARTDEPLIGTSITAPDYNSMQKCRAFIASDIGLHRHLWWCHLCRLHQPATRSIGPYAEPAISRSLRGAYWSGLDRSALTTTGISGVDTWQPQPPLFGLPVQAFDKGHPPHRLLLQKHRAVDRLGSLPFSLVAARSGYCRSHRQQEPVKLRNRVASMTAQRQTQVEEGDRNGAVYSRAPMYSAAPKM